MMIKRPQLLLYTILAGVVFSVQPAHAQTKAEVEKYLHEELSYEEFEMMRDIRKETKQDYSDIFETRIEPIRFERQQEADRQKLRKFGYQIPDRKEVDVMSKPEVFRPTSAVDTRPVTVKDAGPAERSKPVEKAVPVTVKEEASKTEAQKTKSSIREKLKEAREYEGKLKKRRPVIDRKVATSRARDKRNTIKDYNRTKKKKRFGTKYIEQDENGMPIDNKDDGFYSEGFKEKPFGSKKIKGLYQKDNESSSFGDFPERTSESKFRKKLNRKKTLGTRQDKKMFNRPDSGK